MTNRVFRLVNEHARVGGVCGGLAYWLGVPTWMVRLGAVLCVFGAGTGFGAYLLLWMFVPEWESDPKDYVEVTTS